jgi:hypothetical protein
MGASGLTLADVKGASYGPTIKDQLVEERATKNSLEARGIGIVTSSGALTTLLFGLVAFTRGSNSALHWDIGAPATYALIAGVLLFSLAAVAGLAANFPGKYREAGLEHLEQRVDKEEWFKPDPIEAARRDARLNLDILKGARDVNSRKAKSIRWGIGFEVLGGAAVAIAGRP